MNKDEIIAIVAFDKCQNCGAQHCFLNPKNTAGNPIGESDLEEFFKKLQDKDFEEINELDNRLARLVCDEFLLAVYDKISGN